MSTKKDDLKYSLGDIVKIDYTPELQRKSELNKKQKFRQNRPAIIVGIVEKEEIGDWGQIAQLFRYNVLVGKEKIEIDQSCLTNL